MKKGTVFVISGPSGAGKHTLLQPILDRDPDIEYSVSATTREPRPGEKDGEDYHFLSEAEFRRRLEEREFAEWAEVHGHLYGTLNAELDRKVSSGKDVVLEIDVQGMRNVKELRPDVVSVFIMPPSLDVLIKRLRGRGTNDEEDIALRIANARGEMAAVNEYDHVVVNDDVEKAIAELEAVIRAEREKAGNRQPNGLSQN